VSTVPLGSLPPARPGEATRAPLALSLAGHAAAIALLVWMLREAVPPPLPPSYAVSLVAAPPGPRAAATSPVPAPLPTPAAGERATPAAATPAPAAKAAPTPAPATPSVAAAPVARAPTKSPAPAPTKRATPATRTTPVAPTKPATPTPGAAGRTAGAPATGAERPARGGATGGAGADVATVKTDGIAFPYPGYLENIVRQVALNFRPRAGSTLRADVAFTIQRDGTVSDIRLVTKSGNYAFDLECIGAVEAVGGRRGFGPLPRGFRDDALPVVFAFDPRTLR
jgi:outer membrane biosynthesis protein TonB